MRYVLSYKVNSKIREAKDVTRENCGTTLQFHRADFHTARGRLA